MVGIIKKILFENEDNGYYIADLELSEYSKDEVPQKFHDSHITVKGYFPCREDMKIEITGKYVVYKGKPQIEVENFSEVLPVTNEGIIAYLSSGMIKGIGKVTAKRIVDTFGSNTFDVFEKTPELLVTVQGVSRNKIDTILKSYQESFDMKRIVQMLMPYGISANKCFKIQKVFAEKSLDIVRYDTYQLTKINGFGFKTVDEIALKLGCTPFDSNRVRAGVKFVLEEAQSQGHLFLPQIELLNKTYELLNEKFAGQEVVTNSLIIKTICNLADEGDLRGDNGNAYLAKNFERETFVANEIADRIKKSNGKKLSDEKILDVVSAIEDENNITLAENQKEAVIKAVSNSFLLLTGGAGTGKTTVLKFILEACERLTECKSVCLLAPTGRAASRMTEAVGRTATTIHSKLQLREDSKDNEGAVIDDDIVVVDETSMCDMYIFSELIKSVPKKSKLILIGDSEQLPSVGAGNVLFELLNSPVAKVELKQIQRQKGNDNPIITNSLAVRQGNINLDYTSDKFKLYHTDSQEEAQSRIIKLFLNKVASYGIENVAVLAPMRKGAAGTNELNKALQNAYNPYRKGTKIIRKGKNEYRVGDKIMQVKNDYSIVWESSTTKGMGLFNGEIGYITDIKDDILIADFDGRTVRMESFESIVLAYAITIHKSQGSEFECVIMPIMTSQYIMLAKNLLYTGITRAKKEIAIVGQKKAMAIAIKNNSVAQRNTMLAHRIIKNLESEANSCD